MFFTFVGSNQRMNVGINDKKTQKLPESSSSSLNLLLLIFDDYENGNDGDDDDGGVGQIDK
jgi:hypothetical protein